MSQDQRDFDPTSSTPSRVRFKTPDQCYWAYDNYRNADPQRKKRAAILKSYYRYPHAIEGRDRKSCLLKEPSVTNYGMLGFLVDRNKSAYMDMHHSRKSAFEVTSEYISKNEKDKIGFAHRKEWSDHITFAFERYFIKEWSAYSYNQELGVTDMQLYGRTLQFWQHPTGARSEYLAVERCYPNKEASHDPESWDSVAIEFEITNQELWDLANIGGSGFDKANVVTFLKRNCNEYKRKSESDLVREFEDGSVDYQVASRTAELVYFFSKEYEKEGGNQISMHVIPRNHAEVTGGRGRQRKLGFLARKPHYRPSMSSVVSVIVDDVGHGKFYNTPSFAEKLYVAAKSYDQKMNKAADAAEINCMLMTEGGDANAGKAMTKQVFRDRIHFMPGTRPTQARYTLPVEESVRLAQQIFQDARSNAGIYQISEESSSGRTPKTATQANLDFQESGRLTSSNLKRYTAQLSKWGVELYKRFLSLSSADPAYEGLEKFKRYLKDNNVPKAAYDPDNVVVDSRMVLGAGSPAAKYQAATATLGILNQRPTSRGQRIAQEEAIAALNGIDNAKVYFDDTEFVIPSDEDRLVGHENEEMRDSGFKFYNLVVHDSDNHELHLFGTTQQGGQTVGHLEDGFTSLKEGIQMVEAEVPPSDQPLLMDKIANVIAEVGHRMQHADAHRQYLSTDQSKRGRADEANKAIAELKRGLDYLTNNFEQKQQARMQNQQSGPDAELAKQALTLQHEKDMLDVKAASKIQEHEFKMQKIKEEADVKRNAEVQKLAVKKIKDE